MANVLPQSKIQQIYKQYQRNQNYTFISAKVGVCEPTVAKYVKSENMEERRLKVIERATDMMVTKQAEQLAIEMMRIQDLTDQTVDSVVERIESGEYAPTISDVDRLERLGTYFKGLPSVIVEHRDASIEVQRVRRADIIDAEYKTEEPEN